METRDGFHKKLEAGIARDPSYGVLSLDLSTHEGINLETKERVRFTDQEYQILWTFVRAQGAMLSESEIADFLYENHPDDKDLPVGNGFNVQMRRIRVKLAELTGGKVQIETVRGLGYRLQLEA